MVIMVDEAPSFGSQIGRSLGQGLASGGAALLGNMQQNKQQKQLMSFADKLASDNPNSPIHKTIADIYRSPLPMKQKTELVKALTGVDPFKADQQQRLYTDSVVKRYNSRIKEAQNELKETSGSDERSEIKKKIKKWQRERDELLGDSIEIEGIEEDTGMKKPKFDPNNKEHRAKAEQLKKQFKDKEKVRQILAKEFEF